MEQEDTNQKTFTSFWEFLENIVNIRKGCDIQGTIDGIKRDIEFKGPNVWILICSIFIASIGLNVNSTAVVIGAMLISPLMGPILGAGLAVGTYDWETFKRSMINLLVTVVISLLTSYIYFSLSPLKEIQQELLARTKPTILDVIIAIFGGLAGIIAGSRKEKTNVIPGVAIATALMPPLCTAGFGLATKNYSFFLGAIYLFFINCVFISLSTVTIVRYLHFPIVSWVDSKKKAKVRLYMIVIAILVVVPSGFIFMDVIKESIFRTKVERFVVENVRFEGTEMVNKKIIYTDSLSIIELFMIGDIIDQNTQSSLQKKLPEYGLDNTKIIVFQSKDASLQIEGVAGKVSQQLRVGIIEDIYRKNEQILQDKDQKIKFLEDQLVSIKKRQIPIVDIRDEMRVQYSDIEKFAYAEAIEPMDSLRQDTIPTFLLHWNKQMQSKKMTKQRLEQEEKLCAWLKIRLKLDTVRVVAY